MTKHFESYSEVSAKIDSLKVGESIKIHGKSAMIVEHTGRKIVRFTAIAVPQPKWQPAALRRAQ